MYCVIVVSRGRALTPTGTYTLVIVPFFTHYVPASHKLGSNAYVEVGTVMGQLVLELSTRQNNYTPLCLVLLVLFLL